LHLVESGVVVPNEGISVSQSSPHDVGVRDQTGLRGIISGVEHIGFLGSGVILVVISCEWIQASKLMPSGTQIRSLLTDCVSVETANVTAHEWQSE
jgi:hypothetical protein